MRSCVVNGGAAAPTVLSCLSSGLVATSAGPDCLGGPAEALEELFELFENAGRWVNVSLIPARRLVEVGERRRRLVGEAPEPFHRRAELFEERREQLQVACQRAARGGARLRDRVALDDEVGDAVADPRERRERFVGVDREFCQHMVLAGEDREHLVEFLQRGVGAADHRVEVAPRPARPAPSSLRMIVKRWRSGRRLMSPSRSTSTGLWVFFTGSRYSPAPSRPFGILCSGGGSGVPSTRGWVGRQSTYFSPISACGRIVAAGVGAEVLEAGVFDVQHDRCLGLRRGRDRAHGSDFDAADLDVLAGDDVAGVVEDRADRVGVVLPPADGREQHEARERGDAGGAGNSGRPSPPPAVSVLTPIFLSCRYNKAGDPIVR